MATLHLRWNTIDSIPSETGDPVHSKVFTPTFVDDTKIKEINDAGALLDGSSYKDLFGIKRKLLFFLDVNDIQNNIDFLTSFLSSPFKWAMVTDEGYYFKLNTLASPTIVPVDREKENEDYELNVNALVQEGIKLVSRDVYSVPTAPIISCAPDGTITITTGRRLKFRAYIANSPGGTYAYDSESTGSAFVGQMGKTYKITVVSIAGESDYSTEVTVPN